MEEMAVENSPDIVESMNLLEKIAEDPYGYENHIAYISLLRKIGARDELRQAREVFHSFFPFSEDLWLQWLEDEELAADNEEAVRAILDLYDHAVSDYLSINIWSRYLDFVEKNAQTLATDLGVETDQFVDMCFKKAIAATQYHILEALPLSMQTSSCLGPADMDTSHQLSHVMKMFIERLKTPHIQMEETFSEFSAFVTRYSNDNYESTMASASKEYGKGLKALREREVFELQLNQSNGAYEVFAAYLEWELASGSKTGAPALAKTLFERALAIYWQQKTLWEDYACYQIQKGFDVDDTISVLERATRNCPWSGDLWGFYLRFLGQMETTTLEELASVKEKALSIPWLSGQKQELVKFFHAWLPVCWLTGMGVEDQAEREYFLEAELDDCLERTGTDFEAPEGYLFGRMVIEIHTSLGKVEKARKVWNLMMKPNKSRCDYWLDRTSWERDYGDSQSAKNLFARNMSNITDDPIRFSQAYILYLMEEGPIKDLNHGILSIRKALKKHVIVTSQSKPDVSQTVHEPEPPTESAAENKRKLSLGDEAAGPTKKVKIDQGNPVQRDREHASVLASNFPNDTTDDQIRHFFKECGVIRQIEGRTTGGKTGRSVVIEFEKESDAAAALTRNMKAFKGQEISVEKYAYKVVWVTNYPPAYGEEKIRDLFSEFGEVLDVRLPNLTYNANRRFAYVQFESSHAAYAALSANGRKVDDQHTLVVKLSDPERKKSRENPAAEGRELFIVNIDFNATESDIRNLLSQHGELQSFRLLMKPGSTRHTGRAFAVFRAKEGADSAMSLDGTQFMSRIITVQHSDPERAAQSKRAKQNERDNLARGTDVPKSVVGNAIGVVGLSTTVNEARLRESLPAGVVVKKIEMRPANEGAILEFETEADSGKAAMVVEGMMVSGKVLRVVTVRELKQHHPTPVGLDSGSPSAAIAFTPSSLKFGSRKRRGGKT